jgi:hypothetical protein
MMYAYQYTRSAPITPPADNVIVWLCCIESCRSHDVTKNCTEVHCPSKTDGTQNPFYKDIEEWGKITKNLWIYDYTTNYVNFPMTVPNFDVTRDNIRYYTDCGVAGIIPQGNHRTTNVEFGELRCYLMAKLLWDPDMSEERYSLLMDEFLTDVYGPGGVCLREYLDLARELTRECCFDLWSSPFYQFPCPQLELTEAYPEELTEDMIRNFRRHQWAEYCFYYSAKPEILTEGDRLFKAAMERAETDAQRSALDRAYCQVEYMWLCWISSRLGYGEVSIQTMLNNYFAQNSDAFSEEERERYTNSILKLALKQGREQYAEEAHALVDKVRALGVTEFREGYPLDPAKINFFIYPTDWY